jgi:hypothetical protein
MGGAIDCCSRWEARSRTPAGLLAGRAASTDVSQPESVAALFAQICDHGRIDAVQQRGVSGMGMGLKTSGLSSGKTSSTST